MIRIYATKRGEKHRLLVQGHAEKTGQGPLVCAAVSALCEALGLYVGQSPDCRCVRHSADRGLTFLSYRAVGSETFDMTAQALHRLAVEYPQHVCFMGDGVDDRASAPVLSS